MEKEKIRFRPGRSGEWYSPEVDNPQEMRAILLDLASMHEDLEGIH